MPVGGDGPEGFYERAGWRAAANAVESHGPVHLNWAFRLPLEPDGSTATPFGGLRRIEATATKSQGELERLTAALRTAKFPVLIAGPSAVRPFDSPTSASLLRSAEDLNIAVLADVLSGLRGNGSLLAMPSLAGRGSPPPVDLIIRIGDTPTAKATRLWWETHADVDHILLDPHDDWQDPSHLLTDRLRSDPEWLLRQAKELIDAPTPLAAHLEAWHGYCGRTEEAVTAVLDQSTQFTEAHVARTLGRWASEGSTRVLVASSSMPVRDLDDYSPADSGAPVLANRGVNGIDGVVASAIGVSRASEGPITVLIGDCLLYTSPSPRDRTRSRMPSSA